MLTISLLLLKRGIGAERSSREIFRIEIKPSALLASTFQRDTRYGRYCAPMIWTCMSEPADVDCFHWCHTYEVFVRVHRPHCNGLPNTILNTAFIKIVRGWISWTYWNLQTVVIWKIDVSNTNFKTLQLWRSLQKSGKGENDWGKTTAKFVYGFVPKKSLNLNIFKWRAYRANSTVNANKHMQFPTAWYGRGHYNVIFIVTPLYYIILLINFTPMRNKEHRKIQ